jgi:ubiquinone/menaquinone biosynthesis C-methylase UbiE
MENNAENKF